MIITCLVILFWEYLISLVSNRLNVCVWQIRRLIFKTSVCKLTKLQIPARCIHWSSFHYYFHHTLDIIIVFTGPPIPFIQQFEETGDIGSIDIQSILLDMRKQRLGLIQTADQLRFSYIAFLQSVLVDSEEEDQVEGSDSEEVEDEEESMFKVKSVRIHNTLKIRM